MLIGRIERAVRSVGEIGRVHVCRWGDGGEHLHWWFMARPARLPQLIGSFAAIWDDIVPPVPEEIWRENLDAVVASLSERARSSGRRSRYWLGQILFAPRIWWYPPQPCPCRPR